MTLPIPANVFADGELVTEAALYARVFTPINTLYAQQLADEANATPEVASTATGGYIAGTPVLSKMGYFNGSTSAGGNVTIVFPTAFPHGIIGVLITSGSQSAPQVVSNTPTAGGFIMVPKTPSGGGWVSQPMIFSWQAFGW
jgi:hypothetical protein